LGEFGYLLSVVCSVFVRMLFLVVVVSHVYKNGILGLDSLCESKCLIQVLSFSVFMYVFGFEALLSDSR
jgi:hypothetical protein